MRTLFPTPKTKRDAFGCVVSAVILFVAFYVSVWLLSHYTLMIIDWLSK